jgi:preprotein translocase subunit Sec61beta
MSTKKGSSGIRYFSEEGTGFKIAPKTVLIMSLVYIGLVVLLHIYAKLGTTKAVNVESPSDAPNPQTATPETADNIETPETAEVPEPEEAGDSDL